MTGINRNDADQQHLLTFGTVVCKGRFDFCYWNSIRADVVASSRKTDAVSIFFVEKASRHDSDTDDLHLSRSKSIKVVLTVVAMAGILAKDALGNDVKVADWIAAKGAGDRSLVQGLKGDATYLIVNDDKTMETFGVNAVCTHLGCVVPWSKSSNKFMCPCHGSQYDKNGKVVRGPAPLSLALAKRGEQDGKVLLGTWTETDFRDGESCYILIT